MKEEKSHAFSMSICWGEGIANGNGFMNEPHVLGGISFCFSYEQSQTLSRLDPSRSWCSS